MATIVQDFGQSSEKTEFTGSSEEDKAHAKTFWQSVQLLPPMESRLVSSNIKQRLKVAPPGYQPVNLSYPPQEESPEVAQFMAKARAQEQAETVERLKKFSAMRTEDLALLQKHRQARLRKEKLSNHMGLNKTDIAHDTVATSGGQYERPKQEQEEIKQSLREMDQFDRVMGCDQPDSD